MTTTLRKAISSFMPVQNPYGDINPVRDVSLHDRIVPGLQGYSRTLAPDVLTYREEVQQCRYFYRFDPISSTVINRMSEMAVSDIRNRRKACTDEEFRFYEAVARILTPMLQMCALEYLLSGLAVPDYTLSRVMGNRVHPDLGRTRYQFPSTLWVRNPDNIVLKRVPATMDRLVFMEVPTEDIYFIQNNGVFSDGSEDRETYQLLEQQYPEYVARVKAGQRKIKLDDAKPILRKTLTYGDYPQPFLVPALAALKHKLRIKQMDYSIATRAIEAIRLIKAGSDEFPVTEEDDVLEEIKNQVSAQKASVNNEIIYSLFTNHTVTIEWIYPPFDALLSEQKYNEPNAEIFLAMGFSRILLVGEALRSNSSQSVASTLGPISTLNELRRSLLAWVIELYKDLAEKNGFKNIPEPTFQPIPMGDVAALAQFAIQAAKIGALSKDSVARYFNTDFESENEQIDTETRVSGKDDLLALTVEQPLEMQQEQQEFTQDMQEQQFEETRKQNAKPQVKNGSGTKSRAR
jgi:hypothetical protein